MHIRVLGAGLAGCEAALYLAGRGYAVELWEQKPHKFSPAHKNADFAELVCSNSLKADRLDSASGLLKAEMKLLGSALLPVAEGCRVAAGGALAVDREAFAAGVTALVKGNPNITLRTGEAQAVGEAEPDTLVLTATGPLTEGALAQDIARLTGRGALSFYDAAAPIVTADSIDRDRVFAASRYGRGTADYLNCPFDKAGYEAFHAALAGAERAPLHDFDGEPSVYEGCMPIEVMAKRGADTMRYGPLRPVGLTDPKTGRRPWANVQLRAEDAACSMYNLVGFQTNLKFGEQQRVFRMIPGLEHAEFVRYGVMHRNTFLNSPALLGTDLSLKACPNVFFAGQITGFEGYMESAACGLLAARSMEARLSGRAFTPPPARCCVISHRPRRIFSLWARTWAFCPRLKRASVTNASGILPSRSGPWPPWSGIWAERKTKRLLSHQYALPYTLIIEQSAKNHESQSGGNVMNIIIDAMGGDNAPKEILLGAAAAVREYGVQITAVGRRRDIEACARENGIDMAGITVADASETIEMCDEPTAAIRGKKDSSMVVGLRMLAAGEGDAFVSAGSTGALLAGATLIVKRLRGVKRPAIGTVIPGAKQPYLLLDSGANVECRPEMLSAFATMGSVYMEKVMGRANPSVGLVNNGAEETKGTPAYVEAHRLLKYNKNIRFAGNVEPKDVPQGNVDVVVCDGFTGNVILKLTEGVAKMLVGEIKNVFMADLKSKLAYLMVKGGMKDFKKKLDADEHGGALMMGVTKPVIKAHGSSNAKAFKNAVRQAKLCVESGAVESMREKLAAVAQTEEAGA